MRNNPTFRGIRTGLLVLAAIIIVAHFDLIGRTEDRLASMADSWKTITFQGDRS